MSEPKQIIVVRKDLNMRKGKIAAQSAHASMAVILNMMSVSSNGMKVTRTLEVKKDSAIQEWLAGPFAKICVSVNSEDELLELYQKALAAGLPTSLITDSGRTEFKGVATKTCIAIGPARPEELDPITGKLPLL